MSLRVKHKHVKIAALGLFLFKFHQKQVQSKDFQAEAGHKIYGLQSIRWLVPVGKANIHLQTHLW